MPKTLKDELPVGTKVKLYLTTGSAPIGFVREIGQDYVVIEDESKTKTRFYDKIIGGWEILKEQSNKIKSNRNKRKIEQPDTEDHLGKRAFKKVEPEINNLIRASEYDYALSLINSELDQKALEDKYKSSLLLKRAQIYSTLNKPDLSEEAYQILVDFNEKIKAPANNLSHLYTELARIQALKLEKPNLALHSVKKALFYNPNNNFAISLLRQFQGPINSNEVTKLDIHEAVNLLVETDEESSSISRMIDLDIKEHRYSSEKIIANGGKPTALMAEELFEEAKKGRNMDLSERYPIYLEAAKAFSEQNIGSYNLQNYLEAVAYYSMLKGNSLYLRFEKLVRSSNYDIVELIRLKDSACSYYIESLNLLSNIEPKLLLSILANYLKLNIVVYHLKGGLQLDSQSIFSGDFSRVFKASFENKNKEIERLAYEAILSCGTASTQAWNKLASFPKGTGILFSQFDPVNRQRIYSLFNNFEGTKIDTTLGPSEFLKKTFDRRKKINSEFIYSISVLLNIDLEPYAITEITKNWNSISEYSRLLTDTDLESKIIIDEVLGLLRPYLNRSQGERTNILIQIRVLIEKQIRFINQNSTFYSRTVFYPLLRKWKREVDVLIEDKIISSSPKLVIEIDPPYYVRSEEGGTIPLVIRNDGVATADGFSMEIKITSVTSGLSDAMTLETKNEVAAGGKIEFMSKVQKSLVENLEPIQLEVLITGYFQRRLLHPLVYRFTIEAQSASKFQYEDVPWRDGTIPSEHLFKGREELLSTLTSHYLSVERDKAYILYGLTRTGKSSILKYLKKKLDNNLLKVLSRKKVVITFFWDLSVASSFKRASDFWNYLLYQQTYEKIEEHFKEIGMSMGDFKIGEHVRAKHFRELLDFMQQHDFYPIFFIDEFSFIKMLIDEGTVNSAFLHSIRQFSLDSLASFIFAGTYDVKTLIKDPRYGITGQLVNTIEEQINEIDDDSANDLIDVIQDKLSFTSEARDHIKFLSGRVPYFIQVICKNCGYYAAENGRRIIGFPELETVVRILIGQDLSRPNSLVKKLGEGTFQNNQFSPSDPREIFVLVSSLVYFNKNIVQDPRGIGFDELQRLWAEKKIHSFRHLLAESINNLKEKKVILQGEDESMPTYRLAVDLFRRWWGNHYPDINLILTTLTSE